MVTHDPRTAGIARRRLRLEKGVLLEPERPDAVLTAKRA
jgi:hypothetical protein